MASVNERLRRLEARITPPAPLESLRDVGLTLKLVAHARAELDWQDRQAMKAAGDRVAADETVHKPEPLVLTLAEKKMLLEDSYAFLDYIDGQRELSPGVDTELGDRLERMTRESIERLTEETVHTEDVDRVVE